MSKTCPACGFVSEMWVIDANDKGPKCTLTTTAVNCKSGIS